MTDNSRKSLDLEVLLVDNTMYHVEDFDADRAENEGPNYLKKNGAYRLNGQFFNGIYPYRGEIMKGDPWGTAYPFGIYLKKSQKNPGKWIVKISPMRNDTDRKNYALGSERNLAAAVLGNDIPADQFIMTEVTATDGECFNPPIRPGDDPLNMLVKVGIREHHAPFEPYGQRIERIATDNSKNTDGTNAKNNTRRGIMTNTAMSPSKAVLICNAWQMKLGILIMDKENSTHPMRKDGKGYVIFPNSLPFEINSENLIDITPIVNEAFHENDQQKEEDEE